MIPLGVLAARRPPSASATNVSDSFDRANSGTLGTADTGQTWSVTGTAGISSNRAALTGTTDCRIEMAGVDQRIEATFVAVSRYSQLQARGNAYLMFLDGSGTQTYRIRRSTGDTNTGTTAVAGQVARLEVFEDIGGTRVRAYVNDTEIFNQLDTGGSRNTTTTACGIGSYLNGGTFDDFTAEAI